MHSCVNKYVCCHLEHIRKHGKEINTVHTSVHVCECADDDDGKDEDGEAISLLS